ncbi:MAG: NAD-dependent epimerase/dehydratase family protein [Candidatus Binatia bacterium]
MISRTIERVLVTGAGGFLGRRLVSALADRDISVVAAGRQIPSEVEMVSDIAIRGDLADRGVVRKALEALTEKSLPDPSRAAIHLAAAANAQTFTEESPKVFEENVVRTFELLEECRRAGVRRFVFPSTGLVYGRGGSEPFTEESLPKPGSFYAATKFAAEALVRGFAADYGFSCDIVRLSNVYGPQSGENTVVGRILRQIRHGKNIQVCALSPVRDFIYVDDAASGFVRLFRAGAEPGYRVFNLSTGVGTSIRELARTAAMVAGRPVMDPDSPSETDADSVILSNDRLAARTAWKPAWTLVEGLKHSIQ